MLETRLKLARFALTTLLNHCYSGGQEKMFPAKKRSRTLIFNWIAFSFDHNTHSLQLSFTQCCFNFSAISRIDDGGVGPLHRLLQHIPKVLHGVEVSTVWGPIHV